MTALRYHFDPSALFLPWIAARPSGHEQHQGVGVPALPQDAWILALQKQLDNFALWRQGQWPACRRHPVQWDGVLPALIDTLNGARYHSGCLTVLLANRSPSLQQPPWRVDSVLGIAQSVCQRIIASVLPPQDPVDPLLPVQLDETQLKQSFHLIDQLFVIRKAYLTAINQQLAHMHQAFYASCYGLRHFRTLPHHRTLLALRHALLGCQAVISVLMLLRDAPRIVDQDVLNLSTSLDQTAQDLAALETPLYCTAVSHTTGVGCGDAMAIAGHIVCLGDSGLG